MVIGAFDVVLRPSVPCAARDGALSAARFLYAGVRRACCEGSDPHSRGLREAEVGDRVPLATTKRREIAERIRVAREFGDIAENAEYDDAKNEQALLEHRIATLEERLLNARVIEAGEVTTDVVSIGSQREARGHRRQGDRRVPHRRLRRGRIRRENKLSNESPVGKAIIGHKKGETVEVAAPRGSLKFKILDIKAA